LGRPAATSSDSLTGRGSIEEVRRNATLQEIQDGAKMARLAAGCYRDFSAAAAEEGLFFVAEGWTEYTRWCIADELKGGTVIKRHVLVRGVELKVGDHPIDRMGLWSKLAQCWPVPFERHFTPASYPLVVHQGVAEVAEGVWEQVRTFVQHRPKASYIVFGGHSMGGAVGMLLMCYCRTRLNMSASMILPSYTFGAPPVVAYDVMAAGVSLSDKSKTTLPTGRSKSNSPPSLYNSVESKVTTSEASSDCDTVCDALSAVQLPPHHVHQFVQGLDVIPRCFLTVDPIWSVALKIPMLNNIMEWRSRTFGGAVMSNSRFMYELHGLVFLMEWNKERGHNVKVVSGDKAPEALSNGPALAADVLATRPMLAVQSLLDHSSLNYAWEITNIEVVMQRKQKNIPKPS
jgi:hypothetical protein